MIESFMFAFIWYCTIYTVLPTHVKYSIMDKNLLTC